MKTDVGSNTTEVYILNHILSYAGNFDGLFGIEKNSDVIQIIPPLRPFPSPQYGFHFG